ncbi:MAG TPA: exo 1,3/1,4-beta-D-glucan glucohydrolase [Sphingomonas sp.]|nr:exo 1,3/1,4-beta-D-glucan glucohydrolase [Sphingomonas sp.]
MLTSTIAVASLACALPAQQVAHEATPPAATAHPDRWPQAHWPYKADPAMERRIAALIAKMTVEEKVGQVVQADLASVTPADVKQYHLGSVLNGGSSGPYGDDLAPAPKWLQLADEFYAASIDTSGGGVGIPVIWGIDAVHGNSNIIGATLFPHNVGLGAMHDPALMRKIAEATATEIRVTGQEWTFAPTITVPQDGRWGRAYEGYSSDPKLVSDYVGQFIRGLQGEPGATDILKGPHVIASTKHFLADGGTEDGHDQGDARISEAELRDVHGLPYVAAIDAGVQTVMVSFSSWNGVKMTGNKSLITGVLKDRMGFGGFVVSDWNAHGQVAGCTNESCPQAIDAGLDMYMAPDSWKPLWHSLVAQVKDGIVPMARLDDAVARILRVKMRLGLFEAGKPSSRLLSGEYDQLGSPEHRAIARQAVRESLVLLKNNGSVLPLNPGANILVAGDGADDVARQSGGWTLSWQGTGLDPKDFPGATTIWGGLKRAIDTAGGNATLSPDGSFTGKKPDAAIVVFGETPYAEFQGDLKTLELKPELRAPLATMKKLKAQGIPVVALMLTGRPLFVNPEINAADAFVVAWLPGSEGEGVADMLLAGKDGKVAHEFKGSLSFPWPATANAHGKHLFELGYGLKTTSTDTVPPLSEDPGVAEEAQAGTYFAKGVPAASWSLIVADRNGQQTRITTVPSTGANGHVQVTATDHVVQEGARRFAFDGTAPATVALATQAPIDVSRESNGDVMLVTTMRVDAAPAKPLTLSARSGATTGTVPLPNLGAPGAWHTYGVPLKCFATQGVDMTKLDVPFALTASGKAAISLATVQLGTVADRIVACPQ